MRGEQTDHTLSLITEERENERKEQKKCELRVLECLRAKGEDVGDEKGLYMYVHTYTIICSGKSRTDLTLNHVVCKVSVLTVMHSYL